ncbi:MAG: hypothetical protein RIE52_13100 [Balneola sp.]|jgi:hypothetical protein
MTFRISLLLIVITGFVLSCSTGPEFERKNPYDRDSSEDPLDLNKFPPSKSGYKFTNEGLKIGLYSTYNPNGNGSAADIKIERINGENEFSFIKNQYVNSVNQFFIDNSIVEASDIGFPLIYRFTNLDINGNETDNNTILKIDFGKIESIKFTEANHSELIISWGDNFYLNNGVIINQTNPPFNSFEILKPDTTLILNSSFENINNKYQLTAFKIYNDSKTFSDTSSFEVKPLSPSDSYHEIINAEKVKISWLDNSNIENNYHIFDENENLIETLPPNTESYILERKLKPFQSFSYQIRNSIGNNFSESIPVKIKIPNFPLPEITEIKHVSESVFDIYFKDNVPFTRKITFLVNGDKYSSQGSADSSKIRVSIDSSHSSGIEAFVSAELSIDERYFVITKRPIMEKIFENRFQFQISSDNFNFNKSGNLVAAISTNELYVADLSDEIISFENKATLDREFKSVRVSSNGSYILLLDNENSLIIMETSGYSILSESKNDDIEQIYDAIFIPMSGSSKIALSTEDGVYEFDIQSKLFELTSFTGSNKLSFFGGAEDERVYAVDKDQGKFFAFNTIADFTFKSQSESDIRLENYQGRGSLITNVSHYNSSNNIVSFENGLSLRLEFFGCENFICRQDYVQRYDRSTGTYSIALDNGFGIISSNNTIRFWSKINAGKDIHVNLTGNRSVNYFRLNKSENLGIEISDSQTLSIYDLSKKWRISNFGYF